MDIYTQHGFFTLEPSLSCFQLYPFEIMSFKGIRSNWSSKDTHRSGRHLPKHNYNQRDYVPPLPNVPQSAPLLSRTPILCGKFSSFTHEYQPVIYKFTKDVINNELMGAVEPDADAESLLLKLFPVEVTFPMSLDDVLKNFNTRKESEGAPRYTGTMWSGAPQLNRPGRSGVKEAELAKWLNRIADDILEMLPEGYDVEKVIQWTGDYCQLPLNAGGLHEGMERKPDVLGLAPDICGCDDDPENNKMKDRDYPDPFVPTYRPGWFDARLVVELKCGKHFNFMKDVHIDLCNRAFLIFASQWDRRFIPAFSFHKYDVYFSLFDRSGVIHCAPFNINKNPKLFLRLLIGLVFSKPADIGYDTTMEAKDKDSFTIQVKEKLYKFNSLTWRKAMIRGRATACWVCEIDSVEYAIKDCWYDPERQHDEVYYYQLANKVPVENILTLEDWWDVEIGGVKDATEDNRGTFQTLENRIHRRLVFKECCDPITHFRTKQELLLALIDALTAHLQLLKKVHILHRDISAANIMLRRRSKGTPDGQESSASDIRKGLLIDLDYAERKIPGAKRIINPGHRTGTKPFMAWEILEDETCEHSATHDLESFYYVLLYICVMYEGANHQPSPRDPPPFMYDWIYGNSVGTLSGSKYLHLEQSNDLFKRRVLDFFFPYFDDLKECVNELRKIIAPVVNADGTKECKATHEKMIEVLRRYASSVTEPEITEPTDLEPPSPTPAPRASKRKRPMNDAIVDSNVILDDDYEERVIKRHFVSENYLGNVRQRKTLDTNAKAASSKTNPADI